jgi:hypothetical protein
VVCSLKKDEARRVRSQERLRVGEMEGDEEVKKWKLKE